MDLRCLLCGMLLTAGMWGCGGAREPVRLPVDSPLAERRGDGPAMDGTPPAGSPGGGPSAGTATSDGTPEDGSAGDAAPSEAGADREEDTTEAAPSP